MNNSLSRRYVLLPIMGRRRRITVCAGSEDSPAPSMARYFVKPENLTSGGNRRPVLQPVAMLCIDSQSKVKDFETALLKKVEHHYLLTYLLTPCSRVLLEKLTGFQLVEKFRTFYGTRRFVTAFTRARHLSLS